MALPVPPSHPARWGDTLVVPTAVAAGLLGRELLDPSPFGWSLLRPQVLFGLEGLDPVTHAVFWSLGANLVTLVVVSLTTCADPSDPASIGPNGTSLARRFSGTRAVHGPAFGA